MFEGSANLEVLEKEDIYKQSLCFDEARCGLYIKHFDTGFKLDELNKDISEHFQNLKVCNFNIFFLFCMHIQNETEGATGGSLHLS